jgi:fatty-acid desaturase
MDFFFRLKRLQNILYFTAIAVVVKLVFLKSFQFRRIFIVVFRLILSAISGITAKIGFRTK